jgi:OOP family OmpA-OmpF porin
MGNLIFKLKFGQNKMLKHKIVINKNMIVQLVTLVKYRTIIMSIVVGVTSAVYADPSQLNVSASSPTSPTTTSSTNAPVVVSGTAPDDATKQALLARLHELYGDRVVDQLKVGNVRTPPQWSKIVLASIQPNLKSVTQGRLDISGANITLHGNVTSDGMRSELETQLGQGLPTAYTVNNKLEVVAPEQAVVDKALANRIIEFQSGSAVLTPTGQSILNEMATALSKVGGRAVKIIGHTDDQGGPATNLALSLARANTVKTYLIEKGLRPDLLAAQGLGSTKPIADNATDEGRRRNRRIEFDVL